MHEDWQNKRNVILSFCTSYCANLVTNQSIRYFYTVQAGQTSFVRSIFQTSEGNKAVSRSHTILQPSASEQYGSFRLEFPYCFILWREDCTPAGGDNFQC